MILTSAERPAAVVSAAGGERATQSQAVVVNDCEWSRGLDLAFEKGRVGQCARCGTGREKGERDARALDDDERVGLAVLGRDEPPLALLEAALAELLADGVRVEAVVGFEKHPEGGQDGPGRGRDVFRWRGKRFGQRLHVSVRKHGRKDRDGQKGDRQRNWLGNAPLPPPFLFSTKQMPMLSLRPAVGRSNARASALTSALCRWPSGKRVCAGGSAVSL